MIKTIIIQFSYTSGKITLGNNLKEQFKNKIKQFGYFKSKIYRMY